ncbi:protein of unknown function [Tepidibacter aestuarii]|nr:protein of unknown function [Tepidibacter aestuarii]
MLEAELDVHLGYSKYGYKNKKLKTIEIDIEAKKVLYDFI